MCPRAWQAAWWVHCRSCPSWVLVVGKSADVLVACQLMLHTQGAQLAVALTRATACLARLHHVFVPGLTRGVMACALRLHLAGSAPAVRRPFIPHAPPVQAVMLLILMPLSCFIVASLLLRMTPVLLCATAASHPF